MSALYTLNVKSIEYKPVGVATIGAGTAITDVQAGLTFSQEDPTTTTIESEYTDVPLLETNKIGKTTLTFDIAGIEPATASALSGAVYDSDAKTFSLPTTAPQIFFKFRIDFGNGFEDLIIHKGQVTAKFDGSDLKTNPMKMNVKIVALVDAATIPGTNLFVEFGVGGIVRTSW